MTLEELKQIHERNKQEYRRLLPEYQEIYKHYYPDEVSLTKNLKPLTEKERHTGYSTLEDRLKRKQRVPNFYDPINLHIDDPDLSDKYNYFDFKDYDSRKYVHLNLTNKEKDFLRYFNSLICIIHTLNFLDNGMKSYRYSSYGDADEFQVNLDRYVDSKYIHFNNEDIIITDPGYVILEDHSNDWHVCNCGFYMEKLGHFTKDKYLTSVTLYGDWGCTTYNLDTKEKLGYFCADAGLVSVFSLEQIHSYNPNFDWYQSRPWTTTLIKNFTGDVAIKTGFSRDYNEIFKYVEGKGSVNFITSQTDL